MAPAPARLDFQTPSGQVWLPRQVFLFSGHMIDGPGRALPRFPASLEPVAARRIAETLEELRAGAEDLGLTQGACGGDILFSEACRARGVRLQWLQPFAEPEFIKKSVAVGGNAWVERYLALRGGLEAPPLAAPEGGANPYEQCNVWLLVSAMAFGAERVRFICLWDGGGGHGPGGTAHMVAQVQARGGRVTWLDTRELL